MAEWGDFLYKSPPHHIFHLDVDRSMTMIMKSQRSQTLFGIQVCIILVLAALVNGAPNWPTPEFFEDFHNVAPLSGDITSNPGPSANIGNVPAGSTSLTATSPKEESGTRELKPRWSNHRRLSAREAVAVMEKELERREMAKTSNVPIKDDMQPAASNTDSIAAATNRRSGHHMGITGPVHTFVKTDKHGHYKWGVRHHAGHGFS